MSRGFFAIGIYHTKNGTNVGTLIRSAYSFGADFIFTVGKRYKKQSSAVKLHRHIPVLHFSTIENMREALPANCRMVAVEIDDKAIPIKEFKHPQRVVYLLGAEDHGLPPELLNGCQIIQLPGRHCLNVATAGAIVMFDRLMKG